MKNIKLLSVVVAFLLLFNGVYGDRPPGIPSGTTRSDGSAHSNNDILSWSDSYNRWIATSNYSIPITGTPADHASQGAIVTYTAGETVSIGSVCYMGPDAKLWKAKGILPSAWVADTVYAVGALVKPISYTAGGPFYFCSGSAGDQKSHATTEPVWPTTIGATIVDDQLTWTCIDYNSIKAHAMAVAVINAGATGSFMLSGFLRDDSWSALVLGQTVYMDRSTAGSFTQTRPSTVGDLVQVLGRCDAASTKTVFFSPGDIVQK